jgi:glycosyltransferase involved in cell wall biosynthesis
MQRSPLFWKISRRILEKAEVLLPDSRHLGEWINKDMVPIRFIEIPNAVNTSLFYFKDSEADHKLFRFIHVSTLGYQKNTDGILRAFLQGVLLHPDFNMELEIIGPNFEQHLSFVETHRVLKGKVRFVGSVPYEQVARHMREAHCLVLFSRYENLPCVMLEAFCCGLPVIATRVGGIEYHLPATNGILINSENEEQLMTAMENIYSLYKMFNRQAIALNAAAQYGMKPIADLYEKIYSEVYPHLFTKTGHLVG